MTLSEVENRIKELNRNGGAFYSLSSITTPKLNKKNRTTNVPTTFSVSIRKRITCKLGVSYENICNNRLVKQGLDPTFEAQKPSGKHYIEGSKFILQADKDASKYYLAVDGVSVVECKYYIDGREATKEEVEDLKTNYLPKVSPHPLGISWRTYNLDSLVGID